MTPAQIRCVALFFFFTLLDEEAAESAAKAVIEKCRHRLKGKSENGPSDPIIIVIHEAFVAWEKIKDSKSLNRASINLKSKFILPQGVSAGAWRQFHKEAAPEDVIAIIWSQIFRIDESLIAQGLGVSEGTIRYRVGRGLRQLGHLLTLGEIIA